MSGRRSRSAGRGPGRGSSKAGPSSSEDTRTIKKQVEELTHEALQKQEAGHFDEAVGIYEHALSLVPGQPSIDTVYNLGICLLEKVDAAEPCQSSMEELNRLRQRAVQLLESVSVLDTSKRADTAALAHEALGSIYLENAREHGGNPAVTGDMYAASCEHFEHARGVRRGVLTSEVLLRWAEAIGGRMERVMTDNCGVSSANAGALCLETVAKCDEALVADAEEDDSDREALLLKAKTIQEYLDWVLDNEGTFDIEEFKAKLAVANAAVEALRQLLGESEAETWAVAAASERLRWRFTMSIGSSTEEVTRARDAAAGLLRRACEVHPDDADFHASLADFLLELAGVSASTPDALVTETLQEAWRAYTRVLELEPGDADATYNVMCVAARLGDQASCSSLLQQFLSMRPSDDAPTLEERLREVSLDSDLGTVRGETWWQEIVQRFQTESVVDEMDIS